MFSHRHGRTAGETEFGGAVPAQIADKRIQTAPKKLQRIDKSEWPHVESNVFFLIICNDLNLLIWKLLFQVFQDYVRVVAFHIVGDNGDKKVTFCDFGCRPILNTSRESTFFQ